jgi:hypothetical protein
MVGQQGIEREHLRWCELTFPAAHQALRLRHLVEPDGQGARVGKILERPRQAYQGFLGGVLGIVRISADLHPKGIDSALKRRDGAVQGLRVTCLEDLECLLDLSIHPRR